MGIKGSRSDVTVLLILLVGSLGFNIFLGHDNIRLRGGNELPALTAGQPVPALQVKTVQGIAETIDYTDTAKPTVLYVFLTTCPWCMKNLENIRTLSAQKGDAFRFVGISLDTDGLDAYITDNKLNFPVYTDPDKQATTAYGLGAVPQTIVISPDGKVLQEWRGAYDRNLRKEVEDFFQLQLPGLNDQVAGESAPQALPTPPAAAS
jgi:peroxiredoxin